jgi:hypothetical protein
MVVTHCTFRAKTTTYIVFVPFRYYILNMKPNYSHSNAIIETKRIQKPDLAIRIAWIGLAGTLLLFLAACNGLGY